MTSLSLFKPLSDHCQGNGTAPTPHLAITNSAPGEADRARRNMFTIATRWLSWPSSFSILPARYAALEL